MSPPGDDIHTRWQSRDQHKKKKKKKKQLLEFSRKYSTAVDKMWVIKDFKRTLMMFKIKTSVRMCGIDVSSAVSNTCEARAVSECTVVSEYRVIITNFIAVNHVS